MLWTNLKYLVPFLGCLFFSGISKSQKLVADKIIIEIVNPAADKSYSLKIRAVDQLERDVSFSEYPMKKVGTNLLRWEYSSEAPLILLRESSLPLIAINHCPLEPGDSIRVYKTSGDSLVFQGNGAKKLEVLYKLNQVMDQKEYARLLKARYDRIYSLPDFFNYKHRFESLWKQQQLVLEMYRDKISKFSFLYFQAYHLNQVRYALSCKFLGLIKSKPQLNLSNSNLKDIFDSTLALYKPGKLDESDTANLAFVVAGLQKYAEVAQYRSIEFNMEQQDMKRRIDRYNFAKSIYKGLAQQKVLSHFLASSILSNSPGAEGFKLAEEFIASSGYLTYKEYVKRFLSLQMTLEKGKPAPSFSLTDVNGKELSLSNLKGKIVFMDFWFTGCTGCVKMTEVLKKVERAFDKNPNIEFLSISIDKSRSQWINSIEKKKYTTGAAKNLYTSGLGRNHEIIKKYNINSFPATFLVDAAGNFVINPLPDPRDDGGKSLIELIERQLLLMKDGPYVFDEGGHYKAFSINNKTVLSQHTAFGNNLMVQTDQYQKNFDVHLNRQQPAIISEYPEPQKLIVLSDIEGELSQFRKLLQTNKVIDSGFNWTFGNGHLVFSGDMFDRGEQVTECLWLIYSLEEKAKAVGGHVHFILGNHEIMNLQGDHRYAQQKYKDNAALIGKSLTELYGENTELGRWLRTKNVVEKIGDLLFTHAGISPELNRLPVSLADINQLARPYYANAAKVYKDDRLTTIMSSKVGPFWYRGYYDKNEKRKTTMTQIDSTLQKFRVNHIITGHTIVADTISVHYGGRVVNTDTKHAEGKSEALLIEEDKFYRVNAEGKKVLLFIDDKRKTLLSH